MSYIALIHKDVDSDYGVPFPDLPGLITAGSTLDEARAMAAEALALHLEGWRHTARQSPEPSMLQEIMETREDRDGVAILVEPPKNRSRAVRVTHNAAPEDVLPQHRPLCREARPHQLRLFSRAHGAQGIVQLIGLAAKE
jgi:predicted RNase H-like HicB family nuclease